MVYLASCASCETQGGQGLTEEPVSSVGGDSVPEDPTAVKPKQEQKKFQYVGETSRPLRERVLEHHQNLLNWKKESFWLTHWF